MRSGRDFREALSIDDLRSVAARHVPPFALEFVEGGADDELTLRRNRQMFEAIQFLPDTLIDTTARHMRVTLFGREALSPLIVAPTGLNGMLRHGADLMLARAAARAGIPFCLSTVSNVRVETLVAAAGGRVWMQLYMIGGREVSGEILARARDSGCEALLFTTDANVFGNREWDRRNYRSPGHLRWQAMLAALRYPGWLVDVLLRHGVPRFENVIDFLPAEARSAAGGVSVVPKLFAASISWDTVAWLRDQWPRKLVLKGVLSVRDAKKAAALGCDGIVLSNHGGRQLDGCVSPLQVLREVRAAVGTSLTLLVDGGFRRGTDIVKAMALGADAVLVGRPALYGVAAGGEAGVAHALDILHAEVDRTLGQLGCPSISELGPRFLRCPERL